MDRQREPPRPLRRPLHKVQPILQPRRDDRAQEEARLVRARKNAPVLRVRHLRHVRWAGGLHKHCAEAQYKASTHERRKAVRGSLKDDAEDADKRTQGHSEAAAVVVRAWPCEETARDVAYNVERGDEALVIGGDAEVGYESVDSR